MSPTPNDVPRPAAAGRRRLLRPAVVVPVTAGVVVLGAIGLALFQPWKLVVDESVDEAAPTVASVPAASAPATPGEATAAPAAPAAPVVLAQGSFISHEHATTGTAAILRLPDGSRVLRIENLDTSNGPDLKVWLTDAPVIEGTDGWAVFDDGQYVDLGSLKGNQGSQNYTIPAEVDLAGLSSLSIWCDRFSVSFGAAELLPA